MSTQAKDWVEYQEMNLNQVDELVRQYRDARDEYEATKKISDAAFHKREEYKEQLLNMLSASGKSKYYAEDIGTIYLSDKLTVRTPKDNESKQAFFDWIKKKYGEDAMRGLQTCNHMTLNSFFNKEYEAQGKPADFKIPGIEDPTLEQTLNFRSSK